MSEVETSDNLTNPAGQPVSSIVAQTMASYGIEQGDVAFVESGTWIHASETSATVALETSERATVTLAAVDPETDLAPIEQPELHYLHLFHLTGLEPGRQYALCATATARSGQTAASPTLSVCPVAQPQAIRLPGGPTTAPLLLDQAGASYHLTADIVAAGTAVRLAAPDITLDLGGCELVYNQQRAEREGDALTELADGIDPEGAEAVQVTATAASDSEWLPGAYGIELAPDLRGVRILNGHIRQGEGASTGSNSAVGFNPFVALRPTGLELAGITATYRGVQLSGVVCHNSGEDCHLHHNVITDLGRRISNRHRMCCSIRLKSTGGGHLHHNLIARTRQSALGNSGKRVHVHHNELHIDSHSINSFGIAVKDDSRVHDNRIFGCGDNAVGMATTGGCRRVELHDNYIWLQAHNISEYLRHLNTKEMESSPYSIMSGVRITWGCSEVTYRNNTILVTARDGGFVRGTFLYNDPNVHASSFRDNLAIALAEDEHSHGWGAIAGVGTETRGSVEPMVFSGNTIVSNFVCYNMQDTYGVSINHHFIGNTFVRVGSRPGFATIRARQIRPSKGHILRDNQWLDGADLEHVQLGPEDEYEVQSTCELTVTPGAGITVSDARGQVVFTGVADSEGHVGVPVTLYRQTGERRVDPGPFTAVVEDCEGAAGERTGGMVVVLPSG